ncbi:hypothetical protein [Rubellicoccus peritrichatus]|uniref:Beta-agarase n=1 Tax=Rubellicoccus peritrichatus TaxID=3080537 RepID=A0AAQ3LBN7_9BACT|nr:hypothetical protein [Puniceicoccus sp. CR14]WOO42446.1 hypothetical protein RZN69_05040 [Puniceicoccus sp. CR14]
MFKSFNIPKAYFVAFVQPVCLISAVFLASCSKPDEEPEAPKVEAKAPVEAETQVTPPITPKYEVVNVTLDPTTTLSIQGQTELQRSHYFSIDSSSATNIPAHLRAYLTNDLEIQVNQSRTQDQAIPALASYFQGDYRSLFRVLQEIAPTINTNDAYSVPIDLLTLDDQGATHTFETLLNLLQNAAIAQYSKEIQLNRIAPDSTEDDDIQRFNQKVSNAIQLMEYPHIFDNAIPPIKLQTKIPADGNVLENALFMVSSSGEWIPTPALWFYEFFKGVNGQRLNVESSDTRIQVRAFRDDSQVVVIAENQSAEPKTLIFNPDFGQSLTVRRLLLDDVEAASIDSQVANVQEGVTIEAGEAVVIFSEPLEALPAISGEQKALTHYGNSIGNQIVQKKGTTIEVPEQTGLIRAELHIGAFGSQSAINELKVALNGKVLERPSIQSKEAELAATIVIPVDPALVQSSNQIAFSLPQEEGFTFGAVTLQTVTGTHQGQIQSTVASELDDLDETEMEQNLLAESGLPAEGQLEKDRLEFLWETLTPKYDCVINVQVNDNIPRVYELSFPADESTGIIPLPPEIVRVWKLFGTLELHGDGINTSGSIAFVTPIGRAAFHPWSRNSGGETILSGHANRLKANDKSGYEGYAIDYRGPGEIKSMKLKSDGGISQHFDMSQWTLLGADKPIEPVSIQVDTTQYRGIDGEHNLLRDRFWRIAGSNGGGTGREKTISYPVKRGFYPGRGIRKLDGLEHWGFEGRKLVENKRKPGIPDYSIFKNIQENKSEIKRREELFGKDFVWADCFDNWPTFMRLENTKNTNERGTPRDFEAAAELASKYIQAEKDLLGKTATWWEVKNESTISSEWAFHGEPGYDGWEELAKFHIAMAERIGKDHPDVKVGGPTSAWMALDHANFNVGKQQMDFMDDTKGKMDFYSHHFYENTDLILNGGEKHSGGYLTGRLEGVIDLLWNHGYMTDNIKPWLITEYGTLGGGGSDRMQWIEIKNYNGYLIRFMNQQDKLHLTSAFLLTYIHWNKGTDQGLFIVNDNGEIVLNNKLGYYLDFWKDYQGKLLPIKRTSPEHTAVHTHAVTTGDTVYIAINNMNAHRIAVDLDLILGSNQAKRIQQHRMYLENASIVKETIPLEDLKEIPVAVEETTIVEITLDRPTNTSKMLNERTFYGNKILQPTGKSARFKVKIEPGNIVRAKLRVCASRQNGFDEPMTVMVNEKKLPAKIELTPERKDGRYWGWAEFDVPASIIKTDNTISVRINQDGGYITSVALIPEYAAFVN